MLEQADTLKAVEKRLNDLGQKVLSLTNHSSSHRGDILYSLEQCKKMLEIYKKSVNGAQSSIKLGDISKEQLNMALSPALNSLHDLDIISDEISVQETRYGEQLRIDKAINEFSTISSMLAKSDWLLNVYESPYRKLLKHIDSIYCEKDKATQLKDVYSSVTGRVTLYEFEDFNESFKISDIYEELGIDTSSRMLVHIILAHIAIVLSNSFDEDKMLEILKHREKSLKHCGYKPRHTSLTSAAIKFGELMGAASAKLLVYMCFTINNISNIDVQHLEENNGWVDLIYKSLDNFNFTNLTAKKLIFIGSDTYKGLDLDRALVIQLIKDICGSIITGEPIKD